MSRCLFWLKAGRFYDEQNEPPTIKGFGTDSQTVVACIVIHIIELSLLKTLGVFYHNEKQTGCNLALDWLSLSFCLSFYDVYCANTAFDMVIMLEDRVSSFLFLTSCFFSFHWLSALDVKFSTVVVRGHVISKLLLFGSKKKMLMSNWT